MTDDIIELRAEKARLESAIANLPAPAEAVAKAVAADRARWAAISGLPEAQGRREIAWALHCADATPETARVALAAIPRPVAVPAASARPAKREDDFEYEHPLAGAPLANYTQRGSTAERWRDVMRESAQAITIR